MDNLLNMSEWGDAQFLQVCFQHMVIFSTVTNFVQSFWQLQYDLAPFCSILSKSMEQHSLQSFFYNPKGSRRIGEGKKFYCFSGKCENSCAKRPFHRNKPYLPISKSGESMKYSEWNMHSYIILMYQGTRTLPKLGTSIIDSSRSEWFKDFQNAQYAMSWTRPQKLQNLIQEIRCNSKSSKRCTSILFEERDSNTSRNGIAQRFIQTDVFWP